MGLSSVLGHRRVKVEVSPVAALGSRGWIPDPVELREKMGFLIVALLLIIPLVLLLLCYFRVENRG